MRRKNRFPFGAQATSAAAALLLLFSAQRAQAQDQAAVDELLRLLPDQPAFCLVLRDVRGHIERISDSPFAHQFRQSPVAAAITVSKDQDSFAELDKQLRAFLGLGVKDVLYDVLGDGLVFAYWPPSAQQAERGVVLARARRADTLEKLIHQLKAIGLKTGDFKRVDTRSHRGLDYLCVEDKTGKLSYCVLRERLVAISEDEALLRGIIDRIGQELPASPLTRQLAELELQDALAVLLVNPRAFDEALAAKAKSAAEPEASFLRTLTKYWRHTNAVALSLRIEEDVALGVSLQMQPEALPESVRRLREQASKPSDLWQQFPDRTVFAMAGRLDAAATLSALLEFAPDNKRQQQLGELEKNVQAALGMELWKDVLPNLGPDWGVFVAAPPAEAKGWFPHVVVAVRVQAKPEHRPLDKALFETLRTFGGLFALSQSKEGKPMSVQTLLRDGTPMVVLTGEKVFPPGCQPTLAMKGGCMVFASSPEAVALLKDRPARPVAAGPADRIVFARLPVQEGVAYLKQKERREAITAAISKAHGISPKDVDDALTKLTEVLGLFDQVELIQNQAPNQLHLSLHLKTVKPLKK
jgi:hypothetical protein